MSMSSVPWRSPARCCACFAMEDILPSKRVRTWHRGLPVPGSSDAYRALQRHLSPFVDTSMAAFGTGMGDGAGRWSLVKYNQPQSSREVWRLTREHRCR